MADADLQAQSSPLTPAEADAIRHLKQAIACGKHWYIALLEAIGLWPTAEETIGDRLYCYLIEGEAFDWLLLAERLCREVDELLPEYEKVELLFHGRPPLNLTAEEFSHLIGQLKYNQYLNYFYGITVEEALLQAVEEEVDKEKRALGLGKSYGTLEEAYQRVYGNSQAELLKQFRKQKKYPRRRSISLDELKEFTYWLFAYRLKHCDKARVASDTKKALLWLQSNARAAGQPAFYHRH
jgi:hypothetical protein